MELLNTNTASISLGISRNAVQERIESGSLAAIKIKNNKTYKYYIPDLLLEFNPKKQQKKPSKTYVITNLKGGTGKTTVSTNLSFFLNLLGKKVLLVDVDPQANSTKNYIDRKDIKLTIKNLVDMYIGKEKVTKDVVESSIVSVNFENVAIDILPSHLSFSRSVEHLRTVTNLAVSRLEKILSKVKDDYDFIIIDTPPNASLIMQMSLFASDNIIVVTEPEEYAVEGMSDLMAEIETAKVDMADFKGDNRTLEIFALVVNKIENINIHRDYQREIFKLAETYLIQNIYTIPKSIKIKESQALRIPLLEYKDELDSGFKAGENILSLAFDMIRE